jgi:hypothetical protein
MNEFTPVLRDVRITVVLDGRQSHIHRLRLFAKAKLHPSVALVRKGKAMVVINVIESAVAVRQG